jgi:tRNA nucleotidyltransferase (CCA-adding enzyme)
MATLLLDMAVIPLDELPQLTHQYDDLNVFVVGGFVRDKLRPNAEPSDVDLMVAGVSKEEMLDRGFREIDSPNNDTFGVFQDAFEREVALAREEASTGDGHTSFDIEPVPADVDPIEAVERDLKRRDVSVNSMAISVQCPDTVFKEGTLFDPHNGVRDLNHGVLRAVDENAFKQDPLRIVRGARFASRLDATLGEATALLMEQMQNKLLSLPPERVRMEMEKALVQADEPSRFFEVLDSVGALDTTFPELAQLQMVPAGPEEYHKEGNAFEHTMMVLDEMKELRPDDELALLMALSHDFGKGATDVEELPSHPKHTKNGKHIADGMADRLSMSNEQRNVMKKAARLHMRFHDIEDLRESTVIEMAEELDIENVHRLIDLTIADSRGRIPSKDVRAGPMFARFFAAFEAIERWSGQDLIEDGYSPDEMGGEEFGNLLRQRRVERMRQTEGMV